MTAERRQLDIRDTASLAFPGDRWYFLALLNSAELAIALMDNEGNILTVNPAFEAMFGYSLAEVEGRHIDPLVSGNHPEIAAEVLEHTRKVLNQEVHITTTRRVRKDGSSVDVDLIGVPVMRGDERLGNLAIYTDISACKAAEEAIRKSEERYRNVFEYSKDALAITTPEGLILDVNDSLLDLLGLTRDELMARRSTDLYVNPQERVEMIAKIQSQGYVNDFPTQLYKNDGSIMDMLISTVVREATEDHPEVYQSTLRDITEKKRIANALQRQTSELELLHQARSAFAQDLNLKSFIKTVVEAITDTFGYTLVSMYLLEDNVLHLQHQVGYEQVIQTMPIEKGIMGRAARTGQSILLEDVNADPDFVADFDDLISEICIPVVHNEQVIGVLNVESMAGVVLGEDDLALMEALGSFVSSAFQRARLFTQLSDSQERLQTLIDHLPISLFTVDADGIFTLSEGAGLGALGRKSGEAVGWSIFDMHADHPQIPRNIRRALQGESFKDDVVIGEHTFDSSYSPLYNKKGHINGVLGLSTIITERVKAEKQLRYNAFHDTLTHLPNRALFMNRLEHVIIRGERIPEYLFAVLFMDLDRLKHVNDSLGHQIGDKLLVEIGERVKGCLRPGDTVARLGGDEFAILCDNISGVSDAVRIAERVQEQMSEAFLIDGHTIYASFSTGISIRSAAEMNAESYLRDADLAMYRAKQQGAGSFAIFDQSLHEQAVERLGLETDLRTALKEQQFEVHYQPICNLADGQVLGFEALARWQHPQRGLLEPDEFLKTAEDIGIISQIDAYVLQQAWAQASQWHADHPDQHLHMNINTSGAQLNPANFIDQLQGEMLANDHGKLNICIEVTENAAMSKPEASIEALAQIRERGIQVYLDDFGIGHSSMSYLHRLPLDALKIDRSFIHTFSSDTVVAEIVQTIITLAQKLELRLVAEGIETEEQSLALQAMGCTCGQGYFFARPMDAVTASEYLNKNLGGMRG